MNLTMRSAAAALLAASLCAPAALADDKPMAMKGMSMTPAPAATPADRAYAKANATMMRDMNAKPSGDADRDFVTMMLPHHQGAVDMAKVELQYGTDPKLRAMAGDVIKAQEAEIADMQAWKKAHPR